MALSFGVTSPLLARSGADMNARTSSDVLHNLHTYQGIRRPDLVSFVRPALTTWNVQEDPDPITLRVRLICHLTGVLARFGDPHINRLGRAAYNIDRDPTMYGFSWTERLKRLDGLKSRTSQRTFADIIKPAVIRALDGPLIVIPSDQLIEAVRLEMDFASRVRDLPVKTGNRSPVGPDFQSSEYHSLRQAIRGLYIAPLADSIESLFRIQVITPRPKGAGLIVTKTSRAGYWVCAFTSIELLRTHATAARFPWAGTWLEVNGAELIRRVLSLPVPAGLVVDPPASPADDISYTLPLPASRLRSLRHEKPSAPWALEH
jgi:hypothetical protein